MPGDSYKKTVASIKRSRTKRLAKLITTAFILYRKKQDEKLYNIICEEFMSLGGVYVKFLQGVMLRSKVMKKWHNPEKLRIFENLEYEPLDIGHLLRSELGSEKLSQIALVQPEPFAAGSFGQVYYAQMRTGETIIIKVLRPMIRETLKHDIRLLSRFYKTFFSKMYKNVSIDFDNAFKDFADATLRETDYRQEAMFADEMYKIYQDHKSIFIPKTYMDLCTDNIIVQEYVNGISLATVVKLHAQGVNPAEYIKSQTGSDLSYLLEEFGYESLIGIFEMPRVQGDPHPGNIRIMKDNRIGLIDFGISARAPEDKNGMFGLIESYDKVIKGKQSVMDMFESSMKFFVNDLYISLKKISEHFGRSGDESYIKEVSKIAGKVFYDATGTDLISLGKGEDDAGAIVGINKIVNKGNRFGFVVKVEATDMLRAIQTYTSLLASLGMYKKVMPKALNRATKHIYETQPELTSFNDESVDISSAIEIIASWMERIADNDPVLFGKIARKIRMKTKEPKQELNTQGEPNA